MSRLQGFFFFIVCSFLLPKSVYSHEILVHSAWSNPSIQGNSLLGIWGTTKGDIYTVGEIGTMVRKKSKTWKIVDTGTDIWLSDIWGFESESRLFICGYNGTIFEFKEDTFKRHKTNLTNDLNAIWGMNGNSIYAVGDRGTIIYYDGNGWEKMDSGGKNLLFDVWGSSKDDVYAVGGRGTVLHWNGKKWSKLKDIYKDHYTSVWGRGSNDIYFGTDDGTVLNFDGKNWTDLKHPAKGSVKDIKGLGNNEIIVISDPLTVLSYKNKKWTKQNIIDPGVTLRSMWVDTKGNITVVGDGGAIYEGEGQSNKWKIINKGIKTDIHTSVHSSNDHIYVAGSYGHIGELRNFSWFFFEGAITGTIREMIATKNGLIVQGDRCEIYSFINNKWLKYPDCKQSAAAVLEDNKQTIYVAGEKGYLAYLRDNKWVTLDLGSKEKLRDIYQTPSGAITAVGHNGTIISFLNGKNGDIKVDTPDTKENLYAVTGVIGSEVRYAVGDYGTVLVNKDGKWIKLQSPTRDALRAVSVLNEKILIAAGDNGGIFILHEGTWKKVPSITNNTLRDIVIKNKEEIFVSGDFGTIIKLSLTYRNK